MKILKKILIQLIFIFILIPPKVKACECLSRSNYYEKISMNDNLSLIKVREINLLSKQEIAQGDGNFILSEYEVEFEQKNFPQTSTLGASTIKLSVPSEISGKVSCEVFCDDIIAKDFHINTLMKIGSEYLIFTTDESQLKISAQVEVREDGKLVEGFYKYDTDNYLSEIISSVSEMRFGNQQNNLSSIPIIISLFIIFLGIIFFYFNFKRLKSLLRK